MNGLSGFESYSPGVGNVQYQDQDDQNEVFNVVTEKGLSEVDIQRDQMIIQFQNSMEMNMLNLKEEAKTLTSKHGMNEEALLIQ